MLRELGFLIGHGDATAVIGEGGMGHVYEENDIECNQQVALSALPEAVPIAKLTAEVCRVHERGIIQRDWKPANIMLRPDGAVKVLDLGRPTLFLSPSTCPV